MGAGGLSNRERPGTARLGASDWILPKDEVARWIDRARPGERLIYAHGQQLIRGETSLFVRELAIAGSVDPVQPRSPAGGFDFTIQKRGGQKQDGAGPSPRPSPARGEGDVLDEQGLRILAIFTTQANVRARAASDAELARITGLDTRGQAAWRVRKLVQQKLIRTDVITSGRDAGWRIVTIAASGKQTLAPPSWEKAKADMRGIAVDGDRARVRGQR